MRNVALPHLADEEDEPTVSGNRLENQLSAGVDLGRQAIRLADPPASAGGASLNGGSRGVMIATQPVGVAATSDSPPQHGSASAGSQVRPSVEIPRHRRFAGH